MQKGGRSYSAIISAAIFIGLEVAALSLLSSSSTLQDIWLNRASHRVMASIWGGGESVRNFFSLKEQNRILAQENMELTRKLLSYNRFQESLEAQEQMPLPSSGFEYIPATIVKMSRNTQRNYIVLDKGSADGVHPEDGIITSSGVVGMVEAVDEHYSYGLTLMNVNLKVSARIGRSGAAGPMSWDGKSTDRAFLHELPLHYTISRGDTITTSGLSSIYPPGIPLGTAGSAKMVNGSSKDLEVFLFQDFATIHNVTIVHNTGQDEIKALEDDQETKGKDK